jgi:hypothetical protein
LGRTLPGPSDHGNSCPDHGEGVDSLHMAKKKKKAPPPDQKEQWTMLSHPGDTRVTFKKTIVKSFFLFHLGNGMFIINVTQSTFSLSVEFNAC